MSTAIMIVVELVMLAVFVALVVVQLKLFRRGVAAHERMAGAAERIATARTAGSPPLPGAGVGPAMPPKPAQAEPQSDMRTREGTEEGRRA